MPARPDPPLWESCPECMEHYIRQPGLAHAFASVGIEHGKSSYQMAESYFTDFHARKHEEADRV